MRSRKDLFEQYPKLFGGTEGSTEDSEDDEDGEDDLQDEEEGGTNVRLYWYNFVSTLAEGKFLDQPKIYETNFVAALNFMAHKVEKFEIEERARTGNRL